MLLVCLLPLLLLLSSCLSQPTARSCPDEPGWLNTDSSCYLVSHVKMTWFEAQEFCFGKEAYLAEIQSHEEDSLLDIMLPEDTNYWLGLSDLAVEGRFVWEDSHSVAVYTGWAPGQPDNIGTNLLTRNADCVFKSFRISQGEAGWHDVECAAVDWHGSNHALCEYDKV